LEFKKIEVINFFLLFSNNFLLTKNLTKIFTPFCRSGRADSKYIYVVGSHKVFFYYNYIIGGKNSKIVQIPRLSGTYIYYFILFYIHRAILTQTSEKNPLIEKKAHYMNFIQISLTFPLPPHLSLLIRRPTIVSRRRGPRPVKRQQILHRANQPTPLQPRGQIAVRLATATAPAHPRQVLARPRDG